MKPLSERDENSDQPDVEVHYNVWVGMKPLSERDENLRVFLFHGIFNRLSRNEATL